MFLWLFTGQNQRRRHGRIFGKGGAGKICFARVHAFLNVRVLNDATLSLGGSPANRRWVIASSAPRPPC